MTVKNLILTVIIVTQYVKFELFAIIMITFVNVRFLCHEINVVGFLYVAEWASIVLVYVGVHSQCIKK